MPSRLPLDANLREEAVAEAEEEEEVAEEVAEEADPQDHKTTFPPLKMSKQWENSQKSSAETEPEQTIS